MCHRLELDVHSVSLYDADESDHAITERFHLEHCDSLMLVYAIDNRESFLQLKSFCSELDKLRRKFSFLFSVEAKGDLEDGGTVSREEG